MDLKHLIKLQSFLKKEKVRNPEAQLQLNRINQAILSYLDQNRLILMKKQIQFMHMETTLELISNKCQELQDLYLLNKFLTILDSKLTSSLMEDRYLLKQ